MAPTAKTILYGSQARNEARSDSDIDLLILLDGEKMTLKDEESITLPLYELELKTGVSISPIVTLKKLWESRPFTPPPDRPRTLIFAVGWHSCSGFEVVETIWWNLFFN